MITRIIIWVSAREELLPKVVCKACDCEFDVADENSEGPPIMFLSCNEEGALRKIGEEWELEMHEE